MIYGEKEWSETLPDGRVFKSGQNDNGLYFGEIRDGITGSVDSCCLRDTVIEVRRWAREKIDMDKIIMKEGRENENQKMGRDKKGKYNNFGQ